jgi:curved DNA-binding protein CbpA
MSKSLYEILEVSQDASEKDILSSILEELKNLNNQTKTTETKLNKLTEQFGDNFEALNSSVSQNGEKITQIAETLRQESEAIIKISKELSAQLQNIEHTVSYLH